MNTDTNDYFAFEAQHKGKPVLKVVRRGHSQGLLLEVEEHLVDTQSSTEVYLAGRQIFVVKSSRRVSAQEEVRQLDPRSLRLGSGYLVFTSGQTNLTQAFRAATNGERWSYLSSLDLTFLDLRTSRRETIPLWTTGIPLVVKEQTILLARLRYPKEASRDIEDKRFTEQFLLVRRHLKTGRETIVGPLVGCNALDFWRRNRQAKVIFLKRGSRVEWIR